LSFLSGAAPRARYRERSSGPSNQTRTVHQRSTNQNRPHCTATYLDQLSLHIPHKVAPALFGSRLLSLFLSLCTTLPRGQHDSRPQPTTISFWKKHTDLQCLRNNQGKHKNKVFKQVKFFQISYKRFNILILSQENKSLVMFFTFWYSFDAKNLFGKIYFWHIVFLN
jgi:hypothetical protein